MTMMQRVRSLAGMASGTLLCLLGLPDAAAAATYNIANGDVAGLKAAILAANNLPGADTIILALNGTYTLTAAEANSSGLPTVTGSLEIIGNNSRIERSYASGTPNFRLIVVGSNGSLILRNAVLRNGRIWDQQGLVGTLHGGAIFSRGNVHLVGCTITDNHARVGGAIMTQGGNLIVENSTLSHNGADDGGAIATYSIYNTYGYITLISSTIFENGSSGNADSLLVVGADLTLRNTIVASPTQGSGNECSFSNSAIHSLGRNIGRDTSCTLSGVGDLQSSNPQLGPLTTHGTTQIQTHPPLAGSPAINAVPSTDCVDLAGSPLLIDQRGVARPIGAACDAGAHESQLGHSVQQSLAVGPIEAWGGTDVPLQAHLASASQFHERRRSSETHDARRSEAHDRRISEAHDARRSETHDRRLSETHDARRSEAHDRRISEAHDPRRSETHDRRLSETHDARRSEAHDIRRSELVT